MSKFLRRAAAVVLSAAGILLAALVLYLAFGDLSRHKGRIEVLVTELLGRPFAIDGTLELQVLPSIAVAAERVRLANADWGSQPQMVEVGRVSVRIGLWSLVSGPIDVRSFELRDVSVLLETNADGKGNWVFGEPAAPAAAAAPRAGSATAAPVVIRNAELGNLRLTYRAKGKPDQVALVEKLSVSPGADGLLALSGNGRLNEFPAAVSGELGPLAALLSGRDLRMAVQAALGDLKIEVKGGVGRLDPLSGAEITLKLAHPDSGAMLRKLGLPAFATGPLMADARMKGAGNVNRLDVAAKLGGITAKAEGTLRTLGLPGLDLRIEASVADLAPLAEAFDVAGLPAGVLELGGRIASSSTEITLDGLSATYAGANAKVSGTVPLTGEPNVNLRFELAAEGLDRLQKDMPALPLSMSGSFASRRDKLEVTSVKGRIGEIEFAGKASIAGTSRKRVEVDLASPRLDLTPFLAQGTGGQAQPAKAKSRFVFDEAPLPLDNLKTIDARLHVALAEVKLGTEVLRDVDARLQVGGGRLALEGRARDNLEGTIGGSLKLTPSGDGAADFDVNVSAKNVRPGLEGRDQRESPPTNVEANLRTKGGSARQMASLANGRVLVTQGPGKLKSGLLDLIGGDLLRDLASKLNPFAAQDPYLQLDCTVARADIVDGKLTVNPVLMQSEKVTIVANGNIDLVTESIDFGFDTRPRTGVGVSAGMITNPFVEIAGTLASPRLGVGAKGVTAGAAAVATGGMTVLAQGAVDRARGGQDLCKETLDQAAGR